MKHARTLRDLIRSERFVSHNAVRVASSGEPFEASLSDSGCAVASNRRAVIFSCLMLTRSPTINNVFRAQELSKLIEREPASVRCRLEWSQYC